MLMNFIARSRLNLFSFSMAVIVIVSSALGACKKSSAVTAATVVTSPVTNITSTSATAGGQVASKGNGTITAVGVVYSTQTAPTTENSFTTDGTPSGAFTSNLTGLMPNTTYYVKAYATNDVGTAYGNEVNFTTSP